MRLFIAINFNPEIKNSLFHVIQELKRHALKGNFTRMENLHLTVVFIGETTKVNLVKEAMDSISAEPFNLIMDRFGYFARENGNIYWVGVPKNAALHNIYGQLVDKLTISGFVIDKRPYKPHLTIGREVILNKDFATAGFGKTITPMETKVTRISLMKSERLGGKLVYTEIYKKELIAH